jgi:hypothetical protein
LSTAAGGIIVSKVSPASIAAYTSLTVIICPLLSPTSVMWQPLAVYEVLFGLLDLMAQR